MRTVLRNKEIRAYTRKLKKHLRLTYSWPKANQIMDIISANIVTFFDENPSATFSDFEREFGSIDDVSSSIAETEFASNYTHRWNILKLRRFYLKLSAVFILLMAIIISTVCIKTYLNSRRTSSVYNETFTTYIANSTEK